MTRADISGLLIGVREKRIKGHSYLVETAREYGGARQRDVRDAERLQEVASGEDGRQMRRACRKVFRRTVCEEVALCQTYLCSTRGRDLIA